MSIRILGGNRLSGVVPISGAKNAALPLIAATLLTNEPVTLSNVPFVADIELMLRLLEQLGVSIERTDSAVRFHAQTLMSTEASYDLVRQMRASILVLGPLLARCGHAKVSLPGGCAIGTRPVDIHLEGLRRLGAEIFVHEGNIEANAPHGLRGATLNLPLVSVTATENLMMAAALAEGETHILHAAREPEIVDLAKCLRSMGVEISGEGSDEILIRGGRPVWGTTHAIMFDRIEAGTYAIAGAITGGDIELMNVCPQVLSGILAVLERIGVVVTVTEKGVRIQSNIADLKPVDITTEPFPGFPTDLQAQFMALLSCIQGTSLIHETIFENRFQHVPELNRMGANITVQGRMAVVRGVEQLSGTRVEATDLRASVSLVLAGLAAQGETHVSHVHHLDRGYEKLEEKLRACGANIERISGVSL